VTLPSLPVPFTEAGAIFFRLYFFAAGDGFLKHSCCWSCALLELALLRQLEPFGLSLLESSAGAESSGLAADGRLNKPLLHCHCITFFCF
jgi:hypothetical protein